MKKLFILMACLSVLAVVPGTGGATKGSGALAAESLQSLPAVSPAQASLTPPSASSLHAGFGKMPLYFIENRGQMDGQVGHYVQGLDKTVFFGTKGVTFALSNAAGQDSAKRLLERGDSEIETAGVSCPGERWVVKLDFLGARPDVRPEGEDETGAVVSFFKGEPDEWKTGLSTYGRVVYRELWPGIDLVYRGTTNTLKSEFIVKPGADPSAIRLAYRGAESVVVDPDGRLVIQTPVSSFREDAPSAWQETADGRRAVAARYDVEPAQQGRETSDGFVYGLKTEAYDPALPLVIDPPVLVYCGFIGGSSMEQPYDIAVDGAGNAYVCGYTASLPGTFPVLVGPDATLGGGTDTFVAKVNAAGTGLVYCGYIGGAANDQGKGIAVDGAGNAYVAGETSSSESGFPVAVGPDLTYNGSRDAFVAKINAAGTGLLYCGYVGGNGQETWVENDIDAAGNMYISGNTNSSEATFPVGTGPDLGINGGQDLFIAKVNPAGTGLIYCGYLGGSGTEAAWGISVDGAGNACVAGTTTSSESSFPVVGGPDLTFNGLEDAFIAKVNAAGTGLVFCGYIGGASSEQAQSLAVDGAGNAYVLGLTSSPDSSFPVVVGPDLTFNGGIDAFVAKVSLGGIRVLSPNGGEAWEAGSRQPITWWTQDKLGDDKIVYSKDQGQTWVEIVFATPDDGEYLWTVPDDVSNTVWVRVAERDGSGYDRSDRVFSIVPASKIRVVSPNGGEAWTAGTVQTIKWSTTGTVGPVKIGYSIDNGLNWTLIAASAPNTGSLSWKVPAKPSTKCRVRVREADDLLPSDASDGTFTIK